jgi:hypothetical protein
VRTTGASHQPTAPVVEKLRNAIRWGAGNLAIPQPNAYYCERYSITGAASGKAKEPGSGSPRQASLGWQIQGGTEGGIAGISRQDYPRSRDSTGKKSVGNQAPQSPRASRAMTYGDSKNPRNCYQYLLRAVE